MFAICSDLDGTPDRIRYLEIARFLNTEIVTSAGRGVGLEFGNSIYFDMPSHQFAYWNTDDAGQTMVRELIRSGHIDCFHSYGDHATSREHARRALGELEKHDCRVECWVDHSTAITNFGADNMQGSGDVPNSPAYHADLTYEHGVRFVWRGRVTSVVGQDRRRSANSLVSTRNPYASARTAAKEFAKGTLGRLGNKKFAMHGANDLAMQVDLRDGHTVYEFMRCNPHWGGVTAGDTADGLADVLTETFLNRLVRRKATCILYTHLGKTKQRNLVFPKQTINALHKLAEIADKDKILVTTTRRVLGYWLSRRHLGFALEERQSEEIISIDTSPLADVGMPYDLDGMTFYVQDAETARILVDGVEVIDPQRNPADELGRQSISIPWRWLEFPDL